MHHCKEIGCKVKNVNYGLINTKIALFCTTHGKNKPNMIDVIHPRCKKKVVNHINLLMLKEKKKEYIVLNVKNLV
jgi:hypothetical protein